MDAPTKHNSLATMLFRKTKVDNRRAILCLPDGKRIISYSRNGSFQVWDLETGTRVGEEWGDKDHQVTRMALSPDGKKFASGSEDGTVKLWDIDTGKVIKTWTGHTEWVTSVSWSPDGGRVVSASEDGIFRVWDVESGKTDAKMIATGGMNGLKIWDANSGESLKIFEPEEVFSCLAWTLDGKTIIAGGSGCHITKINTATWTKLDLCENIVSHASLSPNERILASVPYDETAQLWNLDTNQPIGTPLYHQEYVKSVTFSADGKFLICCADDDIYTWDVSAVVKEAGLPSDIADVTPRLRLAQKNKGARRIPPGFFNDALREANLHSRLSQSNTPPHQRTHNGFSSFWRRSKPHSTTQRDNQHRSQPVSWTRNLSDILRRRDGSDIQLREVDVPYTAGKPRNYHARKKKPVTSSSRPPNTNTTQQPNAVAQSTPSSSQQPPPTAAAPTVVGTAGTTGATSRPHITGGGWRARFIGWLCCIPIQNTNSQP